MYTFIETKLFTRLVDEYLSDEEYSALQWALVANPQAGDLVRGTGGVRKRARVRLDADDLCQERYREHSG
jgi:hypothetical protein